MLACVVANTGSHVHFHSLVSAVYHFLAIGATGLNCIPSGVVSSAAVPVGWDRGVRRTGACSGGHSFACPNLPGQSAIRQISVGKTANITEASLAEMSEMKVEAERGVPGDIAEPLH